MPQLPSVSELINYTSGKANSGRSNSASDSDRAHSENPSSLLKPTNITNNSGSASRTEITREFENHTNIITQAPIIDNGGSPNNVNILPYNQPIPPYVHMNPLVPPFPTHQQPHTSFNSPGMQVNYMVPMQKIYNPVLLSSDSYHLFHSIPEYHTIPLSKPSQPFNSYTHPPPASYNYPMVDSNSTPPISKAISSKNSIKKRTRTGCLTCRKRRIKCDERKPFCFNCERSKKVCLGYEDISKTKRKRFNSAKNTTEENHIKNSIVKLDSDGAPVTSSILKKEDT